MSLLSELKRRNVLRMAVVYMVATWLIMQVTEVMMALAGLPTGMGEIVLILLAIGLPIALIISWFYELTPEGLTLEQNVAPGESITHITGRRMDAIAISLLCAAVLLFAYDKWWPQASIEKSIAVLPFANRSNDEKDAFFVDGIHDDILMQLAKISSLRVISRTSVMGYRDATKNVKTIGQELGTATLLEGAVQRVGDRVRISVQLIDTAIDDDLWSETYDRVLTAQNIFAIQSEIATEIAVALQATLGPQETIRLAKLPTTDLEAYRLYQLGRQEIYKRTADSPERAIEYFGESIRIDPNYAQAYAALSSAYLYQHFDAGASWMDALRRARPPAERAIQLDPTVAESHVALGIVNTWDGHWEIAESNFKTAIALNPSFALARTEYGILLAEILNRHDEGIIQHNEAARLSPLDPLVHVYLSEAYVFSHRNQRALETLHHALNLDPGFPRTYETFGMIYGQYMGRLDEAVKWNTRGLQLDPNSARLRSFLTAFYLDLGDIPTARMLIEEQIGQGVHSALAIETLQLALLLSLRKHQEALEFAEDEWQQYQEALEFGEEEWQRYPSASVANFLNLLYSLNGEYQLALKINDERISLYGDIAPHPETKVTAGILGLSINRAAILKGMGENTRARQLLNNCLNVAKTSTEARWYLTANFRLVQIYALLDDVPNALLALREAIDDGRRGGWRIDLLHSPITTSLRGEPRFQEMVEELRTDMEAQLENIREMRRVDEIPSLPVVNR